MQALGCSREDVAGRESTCTKKPQEFGCLFARSRRTLKGRWARRSGGNLVRKATVSRNRGCCNGVCQGLLMQWSLSWLEGYTMGARLGYVTLHRR